MRALSVLVLLLVLSTVAAAQLRPALASYDAHIEMRDATTADVTIALRVSGTAQPDLRLFLVRYKEQAIDALHVSAGGGEQLAASLDDRSHTIVVHNPAGAQEIQIAYRVSAHDRLRRIPLSTPNLVLTTQRAAHISVALPPGNIALGSGFPALQWQGTLGKAAVAAIPSAVFVDFRPQQDVTLLDRLTTREALSTSAMVGALLIGTLVWITRQRGGRRVKAKR